MYTAIRLDVARGRPIKDLGPVDAEAAAKLRELGIRTVLELSEAREEDLMADADLSEKEAQKLIKSAQSTLKLLE